MEMDDRGAFENEWASAFENAESPPSAAVWNAVELTVANQQGIVLLKQYVLMRRVAAVAILLAFLAGMLGYYQWQNSSLLQEQLAKSSIKGLEGDQLASSNDFDKGQFESTIGIDSSAMQGGEPKDILNNLNQNIEDNTLNTNEIGSSSQLDNQNRSLAKTTSISKNTEIGSTNDLADIGIPVGAGSDSEMIEDVRDWGVANNGRSDWQALATMGIDKKSDNALPELIGVSFLRFNLEREDTRRKSWAGLDMSGGVFSPAGVDLNIGGFAREAVSVDFNQANNAIYNNSDIRGSTFGLGFGAGTSLTNRIDLQAGLQYSTLQAGRYSGTNPSLVGRSIDETKSNFYKASNTADGLLTVDTYNFISVPIRAGYSLINRKFGISISPGIDSRFYINKDSKVHLNGSSSLQDGAVEINPVTFWGELSTDITYRIGKQYIVAVSPSYKLALNSLEKGSTTHPTLTEVAFSMRYLFER